MSVLDRFDGRTLAKRTALRLIVRPVSHCPVADYNAYTLQSTIVSHGTRSVGRN
jgi:hypothetical protein